MERPTQGLKKVLFLRLGPMTMYVAIAEESSSLSSERSLLRLTERSPSLHRALSSPHGTLLGEVFEMPRAALPPMDRADVPAWSAGYDRHAPRRRGRMGSLDLRPAKATVARAMGWADIGASDAEALTHFKGRGRRTQIVHPVTVSWDRYNGLKSLVERCATWIDYLRERGIRSEAQLLQDLRDVGIQRVEPPEFLSRAWNTIKCDLPGSGHVHPGRKVGYLRRRRRLGRALLAALWDVEEEKIKKWLQRWRGHPRAIRVWQVSFTDQHNAEILRQADDPANVVRLLPARTQEEIADLGRVSWLSRLPTASS